MGTIPDDEYWCNQDELIYGLLRLKNGPVGDERGQQFEGGEDAMSLLATVYVALFNEGVEVWR